MEQITILDQIPKPNQSPQLRYYYRNKVKAHEYYLAHKEQRRRYNIVYYHDHRKEILVQQKANRLKRKALKGLPPLCVRL